MRDSQKREFLNPFESIRKLFVSIGIPWNQLPPLYGRDIIEFFMYDFAENPGRYRPQWNDTMELWI